MNPTFNLEFWLSLAVLLLGSSLLIVTAFVATGLMKRQSASSRHMVWLAAFSGLLLLPFARQVLPQTSIVIAKSPTAFTKPAAPAASLGSSELVTQPRTSQPSSIPESEVQEGLRGASALGPVDFPTAEVLRGASTPRTGTSFSSVVKTLWMAGFGLCAIQIFLAILRIRLLRTRQVSRDLASAQARWQQTVGVKRSWQLRVNEGTTPPVAMTWGTVSSTVLLPQSSSEWTNQRLEAVMLHELAHVRRWDCASQLLTATVCALYWFNPLVWLGARAMRAEAESAADDIVLRSGMKPSAYAGELLRLAAELGKKKQPFSVVGVSIMKHSKIESRVVAILDSSRRRRGIGSLETIAILGLAVAAMVPLMIIKPVVASESKVHSSTLSQDIADPQHFIETQNDLSMIASVAIQQDAAPQSKPSVPPAPPTPAVQAAPLLAQASAPVPPAPAAPPVPPAQAKPMSSQKAWRQWKVEQARKRVALKKLRIQLSKRQALASEQQRKALKIQFRALTTAREAELLQRKAIDDRVADGLRQTIQIQVKPHLEIVGTNQEVSVTQSASDKMDNAIRIQRQLAQDDAIVTRNLQVKQTGADRLSDEQIAKIRGLSDRYQGSSDVLKLQSEKLSSEQAKNLKRLKADRDRLMFDYRPRAEATKRLMEALIIRDKSHRQTEVDARLRATQQMLEQARRMLTDQHSKVANQKEQQLRMKKALEALERAQVELKKAQQHQLGSR